MKYPGRLPLRILLCAALLAIRIIVLFATSASFRPRGAAYWLSPLADGAAVGRVVQLMFVRGREWRGSAGSRKTPA